MKKKINFILFFLIIFMLLSSCFLRVNKTEFTLHKDYPFQSDSVNINFNGGYYYIINASSYQKSDSLCFYKDGKVKYFLNWISYWGHYKITGDSLYIEYFYEDPQNFYRYRIIKSFGKILNDSVIQINSEKCSWCDCYAEYDEGQTEIIYEKPRKFYFKAGEKPDSTQAWFHDKDWYQEGLKQRKNHINKNI